MPHFPPAFHWKAGREKSLEAIQFKKQLAQLARDEIWVGPNIGKPLKDWRLEKWIGYIVTYR